MSRKRTYFLYSFAEPYARSSIIPNAHPDDLGENLGFCMMSSADPRWSSAVSALAVDESTV
jgi:hypothetical protein